MATASVATDSSRKRRQSKACGRCRKRKIRCDFQYPACGACSAAGATCLGFDSVNGVDKPRSIVRHLEEQVAHLEMELAVVRQQTGSNLDDFNGVVESLTTRLATAIVDPAGRTRKQEQLLPLDSRYFLSDSPVPHLNSQSWDGTRSARPQAQSGRPIAIASIPRHVVDAMLNHYCETYRPQYPSIGEEELYKARDRVYESPQIADYDAFVIHILLAISSNTLMHIDEERAATTTNGLWVTAVANLQQVGLTSSCERLQALQLLTHYGFLNPQHVNVSHCAAAASRLAIQLGLHEELPISTQMKLEPTLLNNRRRMFWNSHGIDAAAHSVRCQPFQWSRPEITAKFPDFESQATPAHSAHMWSLREIECHITLGVYYSILLETSSTNSAFESWYVSMQMRLDEWYQTVRESVHLTEKIEFHELLFQIQILRLNRPTPRCPAPTKAMAKKATKASIALIKEFNVLDRLGKMFMLWHAAHCVVEAGVYLLTFVLAGIESRTQDRRNVGGEDTNILVRYIKIFPSLVWKISRRWPSMIPHASAVEAIADSVLETLQKWLSGQDCSGPDFLNLSERLSQLTLFSSTLSREQTPTNVTRQATTFDQYPAMGASSHPLDQSHPTFNPSAYPPSANEELVSANSSWMGNQSSLDQNFSMLPESYELDYGDPMALDFSGMDSEEIFAALLEGGPPEALTL